MRISFECSGGYANLNLSYVADTGSLPPDVSRDLERAVDEARVWDLEVTESDSDSGPPDTFSYRMTVQDGGKQRTLAVTDTTAPPSLRPLLSLLRKLALKQHDR